MKSALGIKVGRPDHHAYGGRKDNDATHTCSGGSMWFWFRGSSWFTCRGCPACAVVRLMYWFHGHEVDPVSWAR